MEKGAHRADYDAEVLSQVLCHMLNRFDSEATLDDLMLSDPQSFKKVRPMHTTVFAKNKEGLKALFELITLSHTQYLSTETAAESLGSLVLNWKQSEKTAIF